MPAFSVPPARRLDSASFASWMNATTSSRTQITGTVYDVPAWNMSAWMTQQNLRNRVSYTYTQNAATDGHFYTASYYTYDVHGNVDTLIQDYLYVPAMGSAMPYKRLCYDYDLISGKVNGVDFQPGAPDAFYYRYQYDAENRLTSVLTSRDSITWEQDAAYSYYKHGPLARTVLGQLQTQGLDYSYTLHGWLKGVNIGNGFNAMVVDSSGSFCSPGSALNDVVVDSRPAVGGPGVYKARLSIDFENGFDTYDNDSTQTDLDSTLTTCMLPSGGTDTTSASGLSEVYPVAQDAYSFSLHYFPGDYSPIGQTTPVTDVLTGLGSQAAPLYNGNIAAMAVVLPGGLSPLVYNYHYDQLNRLVQMDAFKGLNTASHTFTPIQLQDYQERVTYDPNGNIGTYVRHGDSAGGIAMDSLTYNYYAGSNRLQRINDGAGGSYTSDLKDQGTGNNYTYDGIGNLTRDSTNGVSSIRWTVYGKIDTVVNGSGTIVYTYDAAGNRITKAFKDTTSIYVRDAQGNILAVYTQSGSGSPLQSEVDLYGSSRLGTVGALTVTPSSVALSGGASATLSTFTRGEKSYELTNHLGNVWSTVTDKKIAVSSSTDSSLIDHFQADVATAQDYYPGGMEMPGRFFNVTYPYSFNGKRDDNDAGTGWQDYGMREYDKRRVQFISVDPLTGKYPWYSPYQFAGNKPVWAIDLDGLEEAPTNDNWFSRFSLHAATWFTGLLETTSGHPKEGGQLMNKSVEGIPQGALAPVGQKIITSAGSTLNGGLHALTFSAWPLDPSAALGGTPSINPDASTLGQYGGALLPTPFHGTPGANFELAPANGPASLPSLNFSLHLPWLVFSNSSQSDGDATSSNQTTGNNAAPKLENNIALGLSESLNEFSQATGFKNYRQFTSGGFKPEEIATAIKDPSNHINFSLQGFRRWKYLQYAKDPVPPSPVLKNVTNWELHTIYNTPGALERTTFYDFVNGRYQVVQKPF